MKNFLRIGLFLSLMATNSEQAFTHPHVYIDSHVTFHFSDEYLEGMEITWIFDDVYSAGTIKSFDSNLNQVLDPFENYMVNLRIFQPFVTLNYLTAIDLAPDPIGWELPEEIRASDFDKQIRERLYYPDQEESIRRVYEENPQTGDYSLKRELSRPEKDAALRVLNFVRMLLIRDFKSSVYREGRLAFSFFVPFRVRLSQTEQHIKVAQIDPSLYTSLKFSEPDYNAVHSDHNISYSIRYSQDKNHSHFGEILPSDIVITFKKGDPE